MKLGLYLCFDLDAYAVGRQLPLQALNRMPIKRAFRRGELPDRVVGGADLQDYRRATSLHLSCCMATQRMDDRTWSTDGLAGMAVPGRMQKTGTAPR